MRRAGQHRPGFAMVVAIGLIGFVAMTLAVLALNFAAQANRTQAFAEDAQLRQLLLAGAQAARTQLQAGDLTDKNSMSLHNPLADQSAILTLQTQPAPAPNEKLIRIEASFPHRHLAQNLLFTNHNGSWQITSADLGE